VPTSDCGYIFAGTYSDMVVLAYDVFVAKLNARGDVEWARIYGGPDDDDTVAICEARGGGYFVAAMTRSFGAGQADLWVLKLDARGGVLWQKTYGGTNGDGTPFVRATADGGCYLVGTTITFGAGGEDAWVLKLDGEGMVEWQRTYGGESYDSVGDVALTPEGGLVLTARTLSFQTPEGVWVRGIWVVHLDALGNIERQKVYVAPGDAAWGWAVRPTSDGGCIVGGTAQTTGWYPWVLKLDGQGEIQWEKIFPGGGEDQVRFVAEAADGGFLAGVRWHSSAGIWKIWVVKFDASGGLLWERTYRAGSYDEVFDGMATADGGFMMAGVTEVQDPARAVAWILKLNADGLVDGTCDFISNDPTTITDTNVLVLDTDATVMDTSVVGIDTNATVRDVPTTVTEQCGDGGCVFLDCDNIEVDADPVCEGMPQTFTARALCGEGPVSVEWDFDGDTMADGAGSPVEATLPAGRWRIRATAMDSCPDPGPQSCFMETEVEVLSTAPPGEVSGQAQPHLRVAPGGTKVTVQADPEVVAYNVYADAVGSWYMPDSATGSVCGITAWTDNGDGTVTLDYALPADSWIVVTASTACAEGPAGCGTAGVERTTIGSWERCGPAP